MAQANERKRKVRMVCTVGTSLKNPLLKASQATVEELMNYSDVDFLTKVQNIEPHLHSLAEKCSLQEFLRDKEWRKDNRINGAEIQTLLFWLGDNAENLEELHIVLLPTDTLASRCVARGTQAYLMSLLEANVFPTVKKYSIVVEPVQFSITSKENFIKSIGYLFQEFDRQLETSEEKQETLVFCTTGGFKAEAAFAMMYAQIHSISSLYNFENSVEAYEVMSLPLGFSYAAMDEEINMLKAIEKNPELADSESLPQWVRDSKELASALVDSYNAARRKPYGTGEYLFDLLRECENGGSEWADYLETLLAEKWSELWIGDQISETVEHSRRHSKRLMEFAANLFRAAPEQMDALGFQKDKPQMFAVLIAAIYLHDIGHTALYYERKSSDDRFPLGMFPSAVREIHQLLTSMLLRYEPERYFSRDVKHPGDEMREIVLRMLVPLVAEHHRGYTTLKDKPSEGKKVVNAVGRLLMGEEAFDETLRPLSERCKEALARVEKNGVVFSDTDLLNLTAVMRVIDGCDVQADRVISREYLARRNQRNDDETEYLLSQLEPFIDALPQTLNECVAQLKDGKTVKSQDVYLEIFQALKNLYEFYGKSWRRVQNNAMRSFMALSLANRCFFKHEQREHFEKHRSVAFVLPTLSETEKNTVIVNVYANDAEGQNSKNRDDNVAYCVGEIDGEYAKVKNVLDDKLKFKAEADS